MEIESKVGKIEYSDEIVYTFLSDFNNFKALVPAEKIKSWSSSADHCHFSVAGMGETGLRIIERVPNKLVKITTETGSTMSFLMWIQLKQAGENDTRVKITVKADINIMLAPVVKGPLKSFADSLIDKMVEFQFPKL